MNKTLLIVGIIGLSLCAPGVTRASFSFGSISNDQLYFVGDQNAIVVNQTRTSAAYDINPPAGVTCESEAQQSGLSDSNNYWCVQKAIPGSISVGNCVFLCQVGVGSGSLPGGGPTGGGSMTTYILSSPPVGQPLSYFTNATVNEQNAMYDLMMCFAMPSYTGLGCELKKHVPVNASPTATLSANPTSIVSGSSSVLTWSSTNATSCTGTGFSTGGATSGSVSTGSLSSTTTYSVSCAGTGGTATDSETVTVTGAGAANLTAGAITPTTATAGTAVSLSSVITNTGTGPTGAPFTDIFQRATDASGTGATIIGTFTSGIPNGFPAGYGEPNAQISYTFPSAGTYYVRACADNNASWVGAITESNEADNCGPWTQVAVSSSCTGASCLPGGGTLSCVAAPTTLTAGGSSTWTASPSGLGTYAWTPSETGTPVSGTQTLSRTYSSAGTYAMSVSAGGATASCTNSVTVGAPACGVAVPSISASPTRVQTGGTATLTVSASGVDGTCTVTGPGVSRTISGSSCSVPNTTVTTGAITSLSTYTISCDSGEASAKVLVNVVPKIQEF